MSTSNFLTHAQAQSVCNALIEQNKSGGGFQAIDVGDMRVAAYSSGAVQVINKHGQFEHHHSQPAFAATYGVN